MKRVLFLACTALALAGDYHSVVIPTGKPCCPCHCEYRPDEDVTYYGEDLRVRYKYFGGVPHICIGTHCRDEKGVDLSKPHAPHVCKGEWCDKRCCYSLDDYMNLNGPFSPDLGGNPAFPVIPTPPPVSSMN